MSQEFQEHWLSAYLDNELSADERALVERRLEEDPGARELLEDLKRVRGLVATLPGWQGPQFEFDMSRLQNATTVDDVDDVDERDNIDDSDQVADPKPVEIRNSQIGSPTSPATTRLPNPVNGSALGSARWRTLLAMAAGLLLLLLAAPWLYRQQIGLITDARSIAPGAPAVGSAGSEAAHAGPEVLGENLVDQSLPAGSLESLQMPGGMGGGLGGSSGLPDAEIPEAATKLAKNFADSPRDLNMLPSSRAMLPFEPPAPARAAQPLPAAADPGSPETMPTPTEARVAESAAELDTMQLKTTQPDTTSYKLWLANSPAWSQPEIVRELAQLESGLQEVSQSLTQPDRTEASNMAATTSTDQALNEPERLFATLPPSHSIEDWFSQIQTIQPLTTISQASGGTINSPSASDPTGKDGSAERAELPMRGSRSNPPPGSRADFGPINDSRTEDPPVNKPQADKPQSDKSEAASARPSSPGTDGVQLGELKSKSLKADNPSAEALQRQQEPTNEPATRENELYFGSESRASQKRMGMSAAGSRIILFVTEAEAEKIVASIQGNSEPRFWRVVPSDARKQESASATDKKVILILGRTP